MPFDGNNERITAMTTRTDTIRATFRALHAAPETFVIPNPWDIGSAKILASLGFVALATTSSGHAASLGKHDQHVTRDELVEHVAAITSAVDLPVNVDAERCFADSLHGIAETIELLATAGAAGCSIEDYDPATDGIDPIETATARVGAAAGAAHEHGMVLTARAEARLHGPADLGEIIDRLIGYREVGADCVYAPGLSDLGEIGRVVQAVGVPVNVLALPHGPSVGELASVGVRRVSTGGALAWAAYGALARGAEELLGPGTSTYSLQGLSRQNRHAFD
ncbi:MAG: 3-methyl-2-oxobutanoate hydroxymethyltransferase [Acidimicrobiales bacterium]|nr:3-methyl-2-oxobutanoate hydroxymethyltransferase [Acidimicrobiales bacterium]